MHKGMVIKHKFNDFNCRNQTKMLITDEWKYSH